MCVKSATAQSGLCFCNSSSFAPPVATARTLAPIAFPQRMSKGVSPTTTISSPRNLSPKPDNYGHAAAAAIRIAPFFMIIGETAELKIIPQTEMAQFDFRPEADVAGEQADDRRSLQRTQIAQHFPDAGTDFGLAAGENLVEPENVTFEEAMKIFLGGGNVVMFEKFADEADIRAPGEAHFFQAGVGFELGGKRFGESLRAGVARAHERAVNVEQNQFYHVQKISEPLNPARFLGSFGGK